jgi:hypothetical protein
MYLAGPSRSERSPTNISSSPSGLKIWKLPKAHRRRRHCRRGRRRSPSAARTDRTACPRCRSSAGSGRRGRTRPRGSCRRRPRTGGRPADGQVARQVELARAAAALADVHQVRAAARVEHAHQVLLGADAADVDGVDARAGGVDGDAGQAREPLLAADAAQELAVRPVDHDGLGADVGHVEVAGGVDVQPDRLDQLARALVVADAVLLARRHVEQPHEARDRVADEDAAAEHRHRVGLGQRLAARLLARDQAAQFAGRSSGRRRRWSGCCARRRSVARRAAVGRPARGGASVGGGCGACMQAASEAAASRAMRRPGLATPRPVARAGGFMPDSLRGALGARGTYLAAETM